MALQFSVAVRNARLDATETVCGTAPKLRLYTGTPPVDCATAASGTLLVELTLPSDWMSSASGGVKGLAGTWAGTATTGGTAGYFRLYDNAGTTCHEQGTAGASGADLNLSPSAVIANGQPLSITSFSLTDANA
jgi:hypothetical protein